MEHLWKNDQVSNESGMFAYTPRINLLFPAEKIMSVIQHSTGKVFTAGADFCHNPGDDFITRPENSAIPFFPESALHPTENLRLHPHPDANAIENAIDGGNLLFDNRGFFAANQIDISYQAVSTAFDAGLDNQPEKLPRFRRKLARQEPLSITLIGDSISEGFNATKFTDTPPYAPCYLEQVCRELGDFVTFRNRAIRSTGIHHVEKIAADYQGDRPDLLIIAYGMNNFSFMPAEEFISRLHKLIADCHAVNPHTEYLVVSSMSGNPQWKPTSTDQHLIYADALRKNIAEMGCNTALADVAKVWQKLLERKSFYDLTGNGVNHPNDYGHRVYASVILEVLTASSCFSKRR